MIEETQKQLGNAIKAIVIEVDSISALRFEINELVAMVKMIMMVRRKTSIVGGARGKRMSLNLSQMRGREMPKRMKRM